MPGSRISNDLDGALLENIEHIKPGRSEEDILYEVLLKLGLDLCVTYRNTGTSPVSPSAL